MIVTDVKKIISVWSIVKQKTDKMWTLSSIISFKTFLSIDYFVVRKTVKFLITLREALHFT